MDKPSPFPSVLRELSPLEKRSKSSSAEIFSSSREVFLNVIFASFPVSSREIYTLVPLKEYLQMLQEPICRMSTISAIFKGFAATIVAGISAISYSTTNVWILGLSFLPVLAFAVLDIYYLKLERKFRFLFDQVRLDQHAIDFSMKLTNDPLEILSAKARTWDCIKSPSIYLFYPLMLLILIVVFILKWTNII